VREELKNIKPNKELGAQLLELAIETVNLIGENKDATATLDKIKQLTCDEDYNAEYFRDIYGASSPEEFADEASYGKPQKLVVLSFDEILEILEEISNNLNSKGSYYLRTLIANFPNSNVTDLIYWPFYDMTKEEMVTEMIERERIANDDGLLMLNDRIQQQAHEALANPETPIWAITSAKATLGIKD
jgi:hypothetical protein